MSVHVSQPVAANPAPVQVSRNFPYRAELVRQQRGCRLASKDDARRAGACFIQVYVGLPSPDFPLAFSASCHGRRIKLANQPIQDAETSEPQVAFQVEGSKALHYWPLREFPRTPEEDAENGDGY